MSLDASRARRTAGRHRAPAPPRHTGLMLVAAGAAVVVAVALLVTRTPAEHHAQRTPPAAAPRLLPAAQSWLATNLDPSAVVIADDSVRPQLVAAGFVHLRAPAAVTAGRCGAAFAVLTPELAAAARTDARIGRCLDQGVPVAVFGGGVQVRVIATDGRLAARSRFAADARNRLAGGKALARNRAITADPQVRGRLAAGLLDLRAATLLAVLAEHTGVRVVSITGDAAELAAGLPARTVEWVLADRTALPPVLDGLADAYRPSEIGRTPSGAFRINWPFTAVPPAALR